VELQEYIRIFRKWLWLILVAAFIGGGISFVVAAQRPPQYSTRTIISIGRSIEQQNVTSGDLRLGMDLAPSYIKLLDTRDLLQAVSDRLNLGMSPPALASTFRTTVPPGTSMVELQVTYTDPILASSIANTLAEELILRSSNNITPEQQRQAAFANQQITELAEQVTTQREMVNNYDDQLRATENPEEIARITQLRTVLIDQINAATATIAQFQTTISSIEQRSNSLNIVERAVVPSNPSGTGVVSNTFTGAVVGILIIIGVILLIEYLDDRIKSPEVAVQTLSVPVLGAIPQFARRDASYRERLITSREAMSPEAEAYRRLRTNLMFTANENSKKSVFVVTSPGPSEGKSVTTANLAVTMAMAGVQVLLVDADLRRPKIHDIFGLSNEVGLTTLLLADHGESDIEDGNSKAIKSLNDCLQQTQVPRLRVITTGFVPSNPTEILGSVLMQRWISVFRSASNVDVIIIDTPPALLFTDSSVIASVSDADVIMVIDGRRTRRGAALQVKEQFGHIGVEIKGTVMNRLDPDEQSGRYSYGYGYGYGYYQYAPKSTPNGNGKVEKKRGLLGVLRR